MLTNSQTDLRDPSIVTVEPTGTAIEFLKKLHEITLEEREEVFTGCRVRLCYRGVASVGHHLRPAALRIERSELARFAGAAARYRLSQFPGEEQLKPRGERLTPRDIDIQSQMHLEFGVLMEFCRFADQSGLPMPPLNAALREVIREPSAHFRHAKDYFNPGEKGWPPDELVDALALAQHYGMPTRLLDWTRDPFIAAYFAASHSIERRSLQGGQLPEGERLAVWSFKETFAGYLLDNEKRAVLLMPLPPYNGNPNLAAQRGLFTLWRPHDQAQVIDCEPLTNLVAGWIEHYHKDVTDKDIFTRVELPAAEAPQLLRLLMDRGYDAARLFPGYAGAAKAVREQAIVASL